MDQELKQRLIGAAVITALAAIFVPMLFDDPIDDTGKSINTLKLPDLPEKTQEVDITPLPEKVEDVATQSPAEPGAKSSSAAEQTVIPAPPAEHVLKPKPTFVGEEASEMDVPKPKPKLRLAGKETAPAMHLQATEPAVDEEAPAPEPEITKPGSKPIKLPAQSLPFDAATPTQLPKPVKPSIKQVVESIPAESPAKPAASETGTTRWYLNAGSFGQKVNALNLADNLKQQGFAASVKEVTNDKGTVFKVRIGPMQDKVKAQAVKNKLTQLNINSFVAADD
jgi:DedD protein